MAKIQGRFIETGTVGPTQIALGADYTWSGAHSFTGVPLTVPTPVTAGQAANKAYVDDVARNLIVKDAVEAATIATLNMATDASTGSLLDGVTLALNDRILIKNQSNGVQNGIYVVQAAGSPNRSADYSSGSHVRSTFMFVTSGLINANSGWVCTNDETSDVVGTNALTFTQFSGAGQITAGTGLTKNGNILQLGDGGLGDRSGINRTADDIALAVDNTSVGLSANQLQIKARGVGPVQLSTAVAGNGLAGGDSTALTLNINGIALSKAVPDNADLFAIYDTTGAGLKKVTRANLIGNLSKQEMHLVTGSDTSAGYFTLSTTPIASTSVSVYGYKGPQMVNKDCVGATGVTPDFQVRNSNQLHINGNGGATGLSNLLTTGDTLIVEYVY